MAVSKQHSLRGACISVLTAALPLEV